MAASTVSISAGTASAIEGGLLSYTLTRAGDSSGPLTVNVSALPLGTGAGAATPGIDAYVPLVATFAPGETTKTLSIPVLTDVITEATESFQVNIQSSSSYAIGTG